MGDIWHSLGELSYRKWPIYEEMAWTQDGDETEPGVSLGDYIMCGAPYGGPIARLLREDRRLEKSATATTTVKTVASNSNSNSNAATIPELEAMKPKLQIFTSSGKIMSEVYVVILLITHIYFLRTCYNLIIRLYGNIKSLLAWVGMIWSNLLLC